MKTQKLLSLLPLFFVACEQLQTPTEPAKEPEEELVLDPYTGCIDHFFAPYRLYWYCTDILTEADGTRSIACQNAHEPDPVEGFNEYGLYSFINLRGMSSDMSVEIAIINGPDWQYFPGVDPDPSKNYKVFKVTVHNPELEFTGFCEGHPLQILE